MGKEMVIMSFLNCPLLPERASQLAPVVKNPPANAGDTSSIPGWGRSPGEGNGNPLLYSCLENLMDKGAWWATAIGLQRVRQD